ncbi:hypothetical protein Pve01_32340 [Planomonospora venezuelensis]|nr:hypothetical protein Pve01_32340 [Planomonospora venezuelensis]
MKAVICGPGDTNHIGTMTLTDIGGWLFHFPITGAADGPCGPRPTGASAGRRGHRDPDRRAEDFFRCGRLRRRSGREPSGRKGTDRCGTGDRGPAGGGAPRTARATLTVIELFPEL